MEKQGSFYGVERRNSLATASSWPAQCPVWFRCSMPVFGPSVSYWSVQAGGGQSVVGCTVIKREWWSGGVKQVVEMPSFSYQLVQSH